MKKNVLCIFLISIFAWLIISCSMPASSGSDSSSDNSSSLAVPVISPSAGDYSEGYKEITITTENSKNDIYYTTDGTTPNTKSNRYTAPFNIIGSKTVKAVAYSGTNSSAVVTAIYNLNAGKSASQLGVITGSVGLASNLENDTKSLLNGKTVYIYSDDIPGAVYQSSIGGSFYIDSLDTSKSYNFYFSTKAPGTIISSRTAAVQTDDDGSAIVSAIISNVMPKEGAGLDVATVELKPTGIIKGVAKKYGDDGSMESDHAGITVFIPGTSYSALTASNGSFSISGVPQGLHTIRAMYSGYTFSEQENILLASKGDEIPETEITQDFALYYAKGTVRGFVYLDENSSNNAGVDVVLTDQSNKHSYNAVTTSSGNWTINDVLPGVYNAEFHKDGYVLQVLNDINVIGAKVTVTPQIFLKENGGRIYGYVSVTATTNLSGIGVTAIKNDNNSEKRYYALTASDGSFTFDSVGPGTYTVSAVYPGYKTATLSNIVVSVGSEVSTGTLTIDEKATYSITGSCVLAGMESGFEGTAVLLQSLTDSTNTKSTTTASDGVYVITDVDSGSYILTFSHPGFVSDSTKTVNVGLNAIEVVENVALQTNAGFVSGNVTLESADIQAGIVILIYKENDTSTSYTTVTDSKGHFAISGVSPGTYRVQATKNGYTTGVSDPFIVSSGITSGPADMQLSISLRSIYGTVKLAGKTDYTGIRITATKTTKTKEIYSALSNKDGFFALSSMTPGEYILSFAFEGYRSYTSSSISLSEDSSRELDEIELVQATGKISGIVNLEGCTDHSGIKVSIVGTEYTCITDSDGLYEFSVPSGNYPGGVRFEKEDFQLTAKAETITVLTDSTYGVLTVEMKATANTLKGIIQLAGTEDYSGITVTVDGLDSEVYKYITESDGYWQLDHVPLGYQTIRFSKLNVPDVTVEKQVIASESINIGTLEMIPDSATLRGYVFLDGMSDSSGINVTITTLERDDIVVRTTSDGAFEANNILASGSHTITFSKEGWDSKAITISDFTPLEVRTIGAGREYILSDTTSPAWNTNPIVINSGANFANNTKLHIDLSPLEKGSGIEKMSVQIARTVDGVTGSLYPSTYNWQNYQIGFDFDINDLPEQYVGNGTYTFYIALKDKSGNISTTEHKVITLTDLVTTLTGVLIGDKLHLREECSPYLVEADCLVSEDKTLVIDPGVEIRFAGNYSISITGSIYARGTAEKKILFTSDYEKQGNYDTSFYWKGIAINGGSLVTENSYNYISGNIMEYCEFEYADTPLTIKESTYINKCYFHDCVNGVKKENAVGTVILNNTLKNGIDFGERGFLINNIIEESLNISELYSWHGSNSLVSNNTIENATLYFSYGSFIYINNNTFINCRINVESNTNDGAPTINNNNFIDCPNPIVSTTWEYKSGFSYNFTN
ncbi:carboxypeptidase regulatory-like domain-containing protein, partial [Treponema sp. JC4]|uniref:carboxypeptidase regulatory-like domain-containing protein n=1 Tax=Treponema sp. JC4 TaxID=1124982 RepID=UPI0005880140